jgi:acyl-coenzyme A synthetase/AMP-(fatty) acid ligase
VLHTDLKPRRPAVLLHHLRLDDVELAGLGPGERRPAALRRLAVPSRPDVLFDFADEERMTVFGTSAKYIDAAPSRPEAGETHRLLGLRACSRPARRWRPRASTTSTARSSRRAAASISGGTDIISCFVRGKPGAAGVARRDPVPRPGHGGRGLRRRGPAGARREGRAGLHRAFPVDADRLLERSRRQQVPRRLLRAFPGVWCHGDYVELTAHGGLVIYGRSDAVLNPGGVRIGTAEIYRQVEQLDEVVEASSSARTGRATCAWCCSCAARRADARRRAERPKIRADPRQHHAAPRAGQASCRSPTSRAPRAARSSNSRCATWCTAGR